MMQPKDEELGMEPEEIEEVEGGERPKRRSSFFEALQDINKKNPSEAFVMKRSTALEKSTLKFDDIFFLVGKPTNSNPEPKKILTKVSGKVNHGHVLAIMGPSGAGKTTLINALTLDAFYGVPVGTVTLNGVPLTGDLFKKHCFVVKQQDKHWPWLTTRETLQYAAGLFEVASPKNIPMVVDEMIQKLGLAICADTRCNRLSGGQKRRLSIAIALLKQPTVLFLDEPTSGLDAAAASNIMQEITRVAKEEHLIVLCTIHQPSTKVYQGFDEVMIMSRGRQAYSGPAEGNDAVPGAADYFRSIGHALPPATNPADHFLDLVNSDFSGEEEVTKILDRWEASGNEGKGTGPADDAIGISGDFQPISIAREMEIMFRRHLTLILRDPILYLGRFGVFLVMNMIFSIVYWNARDNEESQIYNKMWIQLWMAGVPANMGVVAVYVLNDEFKSIQRECQNGMSRAATYVLAKTVLVLPLFFLFALFALVVPSFVIQDIPWSIFGETVLLYAALMFVFESVAELLSVAFPDPILGMLSFMSFWFCSFLFGGFLISFDDLVWSFRGCYYFMPFSYYLRSTMYLIVDAVDWEDGLDSDTVLAKLNAVFPVIENDDRVWQDFFTLLGIGLLWKLLYVVLVLRESQKVANIQPPSQTALSKDSGTWDSQKDDTDSSRFPHPEPSPTTQTI